MRLWLVQRSIRRYLMDIIVSFAPQQADTSRCAAQKFLLLKAVVVMGDKSTFQPQYSIVALGNHRYQAACFFSNPPFVVHQSQSAETKFCHLGIESEVKRVKQEMRVTSCHLLIFLQRGQGMWFNGNNMKIVRV